MPLLCSSLFPIAAWFRFCRLFLHLGLALFFILWTRQKTTQLFILISSPAHDNVIRVKGAEELASARMGEDERELINISQTFLLPLAFPQIFTIQLLAFVCGVLFIFKEKIAPSHEHPSQEWSIEKNRKLYGEITRWRSCGNLQPRKLLIVKGEKQLLINYRSIAVTSKLFLGLLR